MRKIVPKRNNTAGEIGEYSAENANQPFAELTSLAQSQSAKELEQVKDDAGGTQLGNTKQCAQAVDQFAKQIFYEDVSNTVNIIHLQRHRDTNPPNPAVADIKYELVQHGMCVFFTPKQNNTSGVVKVNLNGKTGDIIVKNPDGTPLAVNQLRNDRVYFIQYIINNNVGEWRLHKFGGSGEGGAETQRDFAGTTKIAFNYNGRSTEIIKVKTNENAFAKINNLYDKLIITFSSSVNNHKNMFFQIDNLEKAKAIVNEKSPETLIQADLTARNYKSFIYQGHTYRAIYHAAIQKSVGVAAREAFWQLEEIGSLQGPLSARNFRDVRLISKASDWILNSYGENIAPSAKRYQASRLTRVDSRLIGQAISPDNPDDASELTRRGIFITQEIDYPIHLCTQSTTPNAQAFVWDSPISQPGVNALHTLTGPVHRGGELRRKIIRFSVYLASIGKVENQLGHSFGAPVEEKSFYSDDGEFDGNVPYIYRNSGPGVNRLGSGSIREKNIVNPMLLAYIPYIKHIFSPKDVICYTIQDEESQPIQTESYAGVPWANYRVYLNKYVPRNLWELNKYDVEAALDDNPHVPDLRVNQFDTWWLPQVPVLSYQFCTVIIPEWTQEFVNGHGFFLNIVFKNHPAAPFNYLPPGKTNKSQKMDFALDMTYISRYN